MPPWFSAFLGRGARLRGKGLPIFCHLSCHDATTHHTMLEDFRSPQQAHPLAVPSRTGIPLKTWGESSGCSRPPNLFTSFNCLVSQQASPPASIRIPAVRRSAAAAQGMPTTGAFLFRSGSGAGSVDSLPNQLLLPDNASPIFDKPSLSRHCAASASVFPHSRRPINLTWDAYDRHPAFLPFRCLRDGDVSIDTLLNTPLSVEHPLTFPAKPSPLRPCAASKDAVTQTVAAAHEMPMLASNQTTFKITTKQPSKIQSNYLQMDIQVPHFATSITSAARGSIFAACVINYCYSD